MIRPINSEIQFHPKPIRYSDGRSSIVSIPNGYVQEALKTQDYQDLAKEFGLSVPLIRTVISVESSGNGFLIKEPSPARPKVRLESHWLYQLSAKPISKTRPDLSSKAWKPELVLGGSKEWNRLLDAMAFDSIAAIKSCSWGLGQVMGFNFQAAGCSTINQFVRENFAGEYWQARHMMNFIENNHILDELQRKDWEGFAYRYNGEGFRVNNYHGKLAAAYKRFSSR